MNRRMIWSDIVPLGYFATWACEPNPSLEDTKDMLKRLRGKVQESLLRGPPVIINADGTYRTFWESQELKVRTITLIDEALQAP